MTGSETDAGVERVARKGSLRLTSALVVLAVSSAALGWWAGRSGSREPASVGLERIEEQLARGVKQRAALASRLDRQQEFLSSQVAMLRGALSELRALHDSAVASAGGAGTPLPPRLTEISIDAAPSLGPSDAPITIVEFSDFECPHCATMVPVLARLRREYPDSVRIVFKHCPLPVHPNAFTAHLASVAAFRQGRFWEMHDLLYAHPDRLSFNDLREHARALGLNLEQFDDDRTSEDVRDVVQLDKAEASGAQIGRVPTYFINGLKLEGAQSFEVMSAEVGTELARIGVSESRPRVRQP